MNESYQSSRVFGSGARILSVECGSSGALSVDLENGDLRCAYTDASASFGLTHVYRSRGADRFVGSGASAVTVPDFCCGKGFKLDVEQYLIRNDPAGERYTYLDGAGNRYDFERKYYYVRNAEKHYVTDLSKIALAQDGSLCYRESGEKRKVYVEAETEAGHRVLLRYESLENSDEIDQREENFAKSEDEVRDLEMSVEDIEFQLRQNKNWIEILRDGDDQSLYGLRRRLEKQSSLTEKRAIQLATVGVNSLAESFPNTNSIDMTDEKSVAWNLFQTKSLSVDDYQETRFDHDEEDEKKGLYTLKNEIRQLQNSIRSRTVILTDADNETRMRTYDEAQRELQIANFEHQNEIYSDRLASYRRILEEKRSALAELRAATPVCYVVDPDGTVLGFGETAHAQVFRLVSVVGANGNETRFVYENDRLVRIARGQKTVLTLEYRSDRLFSVRDERGNTTRYEYRDEDGAFLLGRIVFANRSDAKFEYAAGRLELVLGDNGTGASVEYDADNRVCAVSRVSNTERIEHGIKTLYRAGSLNEKNNYLRKERYEIVRRGAHCAAWRDTRHKYGTPLNSTSGEM